MADYRAQDEADWARKKAAEAAARELDVTEIADDDVSSSDSGNEGGVWEDKPTPSPTLDMTGGGDSEAESDMTDDRRPHKGARKGDGKGDVQGDGQRDGDGKGEGKGFSLDHPDEVASRGLLHDTIIQRAELIFNALDNAPAAPAETTQPAIPPTDDWEQGEQQAE